jgi:heme/copper-type cytochrome/quinol oxidase subunit 4
LNFWRRWNDVVFRVCVLLSDMNVRLVAKISRIVVLILVQILIQLLVFLVKKSKYKFLAVLR